VPVFSQLNSNRLNVQIVWEHLVRVGDEQAWAVAGIMLRWPCVYEKLEIGPECDGVRVGRHSASAQLKNDDIVGVNHWLDTA
jgi:hypothetical protein